MHIQRNEVKKERKYKHTNTLIMLKHITHTHTRTQFKSRKKSLYKSKEEVKQTQNLYIDPRIGEKGITIHLLVVIKYLK